MRMCVDELTSYSKSCIASSLTGVVVIILVVFSLFRKPVREEEKARDLLKQVRPTPPHEDHGLISKPTSEIPKPSRDANLETQPDNAGIAESKRVRFYTDNPEHSEIATMTALNSHWQDRNRNTSAYLKQWIERETATRGEAVSNQLLDLKILAFFQSLEGLIKASPDKGGKPPTETAVRAVDRDQLVANWMNNSTNSGVSRNAHNAWRDPLRIGIPDDQTMRSFAKDPQAFIDALSKQYRQSWGDRELGVQESFYFEGSKAAILQAAGESALRAAMTASGCPIPRPVTKGFLDDN